MLREVDVLLVDNGRVYEIYERWPDHFRTASKISAKVDHSPDYYNSIIQCGMGGSGTSCDIIDTVLQSHSKIQSLVLKTMSMPNHVNNRSLVIVNSVSGNTSESIAMMQDAASKGAEVICISSGGRMKEMAEKLACQHIDIPNLKLPRASLPYVLMPALRLIDPFLDQSIADEISTIHLPLSETAETISIRTPERKNISKRIANFLTEGAAFCFASPALMPAATRFKNSLNENAKMHCIRESVLEASHNEIVPFTFNNNFVPKILLLKWINDSEMVTQRHDRIKSLFSEIGHSLIELQAYERSLLAALLCSIYILDYATIYAAVSRGIDPSPTPAIDILKGLAKSPGIF